MLSFNHQRLANSLKLVLFFSVLAMAVDVSHEKQAECPWGCRCSSDETNGLTVNCTKTNMTQPPIPIEDSTASLLLLPLNSISHVDLVFLRHYPSLRILSLHKNGIRALSKSTDGDYDSPLFSLVHMDLSDNHLHVLHPYVLSGFPSLRTLNLSGNALHTVSESALTLPALETLDLARNKLPVISSHLFDTSPKLSEIDLSGNGFSRLNDGTFGLLTHLTVLDLSHNSLMRIEDNVFVGMNISHLDLGYNALRKPPSLPLRKLTAARTVILDGNPLSHLERGALSRVRVEFLSLSKCSNLERLEGGAADTMRDLKTLTINDNKKLTYIEPGFVSDAPKLAALDLSRNSLFALEAGVTANLPSLRALYLSGNQFNCHCSLAWVAHLVTAESDGKVRVMDADQLNCRPSTGGNTLTLKDMAGQLSPECEPYILPLFTDTADQVMGRNISWLCKALGSKDMELYWRLPSVSGKEATNIVDQEQCEERVCLQDNHLTVRYLHPADTGKYTCVAKNKYGQDQRQVTLVVKSEHIQIFPITIASTFVTLSWNTSGSLSTGRGYILQVKRADEALSEDEEEADSTSGGKAPVVKQYMDIDVGLKMNSYTVNSLAPGVTYLFELCLRKETYVIPISSAQLTTRNSGYEVELGIETDYVTLITVAFILAALVISCFALSALRWYTYHSHIVHMRAKGGVGGGNGDNLSQREMIASPSEHSSVTYPNYAGSVAASTATGDESRLVEHEVTSPTEDVVGVRETIA